MSFKRYGMWTFFVAVMVGIFVTQPFPLWLVAIPLAVLAGTLAAIADTQ